MSLTPRRMLWWGRQTLLTVGAVLGGLCLVVAVSAAAFGLRPLVFQSGSMEPTIDTGALAISRNVDAADLRVGDIVSVPTVSGTRVTHRIVTVEARDGVATLSLKGDANEVADADTYTVRHADRVLFAVPLLGYAIAWLIGPVGLFLLGLYAAFLLSVLVKGSPRGPDDDDNDGKDARSGGKDAAPATSRTVPGSHRMVRSGLAALVATGVASGLVVEQTITPTMAAFTNPVVVTAPYDAGLAVPADFTCGSGGGQKTTVTWSAVPSASYVVHYAANGGTTAAVPAGTLTYTRNNGSGIIWVVASRTFNTKVWLSEDSPHFSYSNGSCTAL